MRISDWSSDVCSSDLLERAAANLVEFHRFEQRGEIAFAEPFVLLALDEFEEDRADHRLAENLEQQPRIALGGRTVEQDAARFQFVNRLSMPRPALGAHPVLGIGGSRRARITYHGVHVYRERKRDGKGKS